MLPDLYPWKRKEESKTEEAELQYDFKQRSQPTLPHQELRSRDNPQNCLLVERGAFSPVFNACRPVIGTGQLGRSYELNEKALLLRCPQKGWTMESSQALEEKSVFLLGTWVVHHGTDQKNQLVN